jgi:hypothetical protein
MIHYFPNYIENQLSALMNPFWQSFIDFVPLYIQNGVYNDTLEEDLVEYVS